MYTKKTRDNGFTMVEMLFGVMILGVVMLAFMGIFSLFQRSSGRTRQAADTQQNARLAIDYVTEHLRQAGSGTDYVRGQRFIVHAAPYQVAFNADIDNSEVIGGNQPLAAIDLNFSPSTVPAGGTTIYQPPRSYTSSAETVVLTLDSNDDGVVAADDHGDEPEEAGPNPNLYLLKRVTYGSDGAAANSVRSATLALLRGPGVYPDNSLPQPLFQYLYDHDEDASTGTVLWGDASGDGKLSTAEIAALTPMPAALLSLIRIVRVTVLSESDKYSQKYEDTGGYLGVEMHSEVYVRNALRSNSVIYGFIFHDGNGNGAPDAGEGGIPNVEVQVVGFTWKVKTNGAGNYSIPIAKGDYSIRETDPAGFVSTTPNLVSVSVLSGEAVQVNFGDKSGSPVGFILGTVFDDLDQDGVQAPSEPGIIDVDISLDTGEQAKTDLKGRYQFAVQMGTYTVVETDPPGFGSTTPNAINVDVVTAGDTVTVDFGDNSSPKLGILAGHVFEDLDIDGVLDVNEGGIASVTLTISTGDSTMTNAAGYYQFNILPGIYAIAERDPPGYTSSTPNKFTNIVISPDTTVTRHFGDFPLGQNDFIEIDIGNSARALSVEAIDMKEDNKSDVDIVVGTPFSGGTGNMLVFMNKRKNATTLLSQLFDATPTYQRQTGNNINALSLYDHSGDAKPDVMSGIAYNTGPNIQIWYNGKFGALSNTPDNTNATSLSTYPVSACNADFNRDGIMDLVVGLRSSSGTFTGGFETFQGQGDGTFTPWRFETTAGKTGGLMIGEVWSVRTGDVDQDGDVDIVIGSRLNTYSGVIDVFFNNRGKGKGFFTWGARYAAPGAVNTMQVLDMKEDDQGDVDILAGVSTAANQGGVFLWLNNQAEFGRPDTTGFVFPAEFTPNVPDDGLAPGGEVFSIAAAPVNPDIFPDIFVGTRTSSFYTGDIYFVQTFGLLPSFGERLNTTSIGEVVTMKIADFNNDNKLDVVTGTRTSSVQGKLLIFFFDG